jgi:hypothetical protein
MRFHVRLDALDFGQMRDLVEEAWSRAVPLYVAEEYGRRQGYSFTPFSRRRTRKIVRR